MKPVLHARVRTCLCRYLLAISIGLSAGNAVIAAEFEYSGDLGPGFWAQHNPQWHACADLAVDARQSPIEINKVRVDRDLKALELDLHETNLSLLNKGHTIEQEYDPGSTLRLDGRVYELLQFHFHSLSEHTLKQRHYALELHAVFREPARGRLAVVGQLFDTGKPNAFLEKLIRMGLPQKQESAVYPTGMINLADALTSTAAYYRYEGSLTTPPCAEIVSWVVLAQPATLSMRQLRAFRHILGNNFRPPQRLNHRVVRASRLQELS